MSCRMTPVPGLPWCAEHALTESDDMGELVAALELLLDGTIAGATVDQQLDALDLLGIIAGLADPPRKR